MLVSYISLFQYGVIEAKRKERRKRRYIWNPGFPPSFGQKKVNACLSYLWLLLTLQVTHTPGPKAFMDVVTAFQLSSKFHCSFFQNTFPHVPCTVMQPCDCALASGIHYLSTLVLSVSLQHTIEEGRTLLRWQTYSRERAWSPEYLCRTDPSSPWPHVTVRSARSKLFTWVRG